MHEYLLELVRTTAALISTDGISDDAKKTANDILSKSLRQLDNDLTEGLLAKQGVQIVR